MELKGIICMRLKHINVLSAVPGKAGAQPRAVCYSPAGLQKKVAETLAVGAECDELAIRYKALVEVCK